MKSIKLMLLPIILVLILSVVINRVHTNKNDFLLGLKIKDSLAVNTTNPKVLLNGGSNLIFGFKSDIFSEKVNKPAINLGIMAGLGLEFMINQIKEYGKDRDIVILIPEYYLYKSPYSKIDNPVILGAISVLPESKRFLNDVNPLVLEHHLVQTRLQRLVYDLSPIKANRTYNFKNINKNGEIILNKEIGISEKSCESYKFPLDLENDKQQIFKTITMISQLSEYLKKNNIKFYLSYPPLPKNEKVLKNAMIFHELIQASRINTIGTPQDFSYNYNYFFDGIPHLNSDGAILRSLKISELLLEAEEK